MPRTKAVLTGLTVLATASGCSWFAGEPEVERLDYEEYEQQLTDTYNESQRLSDELDEAEIRIVQACLEAQGFEIHDPYELGDTEPGERESFMDQPPYDWFLPSVEDAQRRGFWQWTSIEGYEHVEDGDELDAEWAAYQAEIGWTTVVFEGEDEDDLPEFFKQPEEEQYAWYVAYGGETWAAASYSYLTGAEPEGGGDDAEGESAGPLPPEGCQLEMLEAVYADAIADMEEGWTKHDLRPSPPNGDWTTMTERYEEGVAEAEGDLLDCLAERGHEGWEFYDGGLFVHSYLSEAGDGEYPLNSYPDAGTKWPDPPSDVPDADDPQGWLDFERAMAVDFAECGDESGYRDAAVDSWQQAQLHYYLDVEGATFAWQEQMRELIAQAQDAIGE
ncbi:hypothetical protein [Glycomyces sp. NPDC048151]|uniref:hypothetical protein n=1 Tax=Glycomyces sp. NPDC048151 TaxID=3364002 RepID=UPI003715682E